MVPFFTHTHTPVVEMASTLYFFLRGLLLHLFQNVSPNQTGYTWAGASLAAPQALAVAGSRTALDAQV